MNNVKAIKFIPRWAHEEVRAIENALKATVITEDNLKGMTKRLDVILKEIGESSSPFAPAMEKEVVTLYNRAVDAWVQSEVLQIHNEATCLKDAVKSGKVTARAVTQLADRLGAFRNIHLPSRENRQLLRGADQAIKLANDLLSNDLPQPLAEADALLPMEEIDSIVLGDMEELMDLAGLIYGKKMIEAKSRFAKLPESVKTKFIYTMRQMGATPFEDVMATCQVFLMLGYESVGSDTGLPTPAEVDDFFTDLAHVLNEEHAEPKVASLSGRVSLVG